MRRAFWFAVAVTLVGQVAEARDGSSPRQLLPTTPPSCEQFIYGRRDGGSYDGLTLRTLRALVHANYDIEIHGLEEIEKRGPVRGAMIWPNHRGPAEPFIHLAVAPSEWALRPVMTEDMLVPPIKQFLEAGLHMTNGFIVPSLSRGGATAAGQIDALIPEWVNDCRHGANVMFYPSGAVQIGPPERLGAKSAAHRVLEINPEQRVILVRVEGLEGSSFTHSGPQADPDRKRTTGEVLVDGGKYAIGKFLGNGLIKIPKRKLKIYYYEPDDLPRHAKVEELNAYLERFYDQNLDERPRTFVKKYWWSKGPDTVTAPPIDYGKTEDAPVDADAAPGKGTRPETTRAVIAAVKTLGLDAVNEDTNLVGIIDSKTKLDLLMEVGARLNVSLPDDAQFDTPAELAAMVEERLLDPARFAHTGPKYAPSPGYLANPSSEDEVQLKGQDTGVANFVSQAYAQPKTVISEDLRGGGGVRAKLENMRLVGRLVRKVTKRWKKDDPTQPFAGSRNPITYAKALRYTVALSRVFGAMKGDRIATLLPASANGTMMLMGAQLAGKDPVQVNFTTPPDKIVAALDTIGIDRIVTSRAAIAAISKSYDVSAYLHRFVYVEDLKYKILAQLPAARFMIKFRRERLMDQANRAGRAAVLFTSGTTGTPKAVGLTHANIQANVKDLVKRFKIHVKDRLLQILPPFHSFGNMLSTLSLTLGVPAVYHAQPQDAQTLVDLVESYGSTIVVGTPTFLYQMALRARPGQLKSVRLAVAGAEPLKREYYDELKAKLPADAAIVEGYGLTEMSPVVAVNPPEKPKFGSVGPLLPSVKGLIVDPETMKPVPRGETGILLVTGPSMFDGYLNSDKDPFVTIDGVKFYNTEDLFHEDEEGYLFIHGRTDRMRKINGEKVSLVEIENTVAEYAEKLRPAGVEGPLVVVESTEDNAPLILFTAVPIQRGELQAYLRSKQLKGINSISEIRRVDAIPMLGTGKIDYQTLRGECGKNKGETDQP